MRQSFSPKFNHRICNLTIILVFVNHFSFEKSHTLTICLINNNDELEKRLKKTLDNL